MLELLLSLDHETSKLFDWLEPREILNLTCVNHALHQACEHWCQAKGVPRQVAMKEAEIAGICDCLVEMEQVAHDDLASPLFQSYQGFLHALLRTPLDDTVINLFSWSIRYWKASQPRPPAVSQRFDFGYPDTGYWCDTFGCGAPNDYFRLVGDAPNEYWSLCLAGSDIQYLSWRSVSNDDNRVLDPVPSPDSRNVTRKKAAYIQSSNGPTEWDRTKQYWRDCGARIRPSSTRWRLDM
ncbi:unnamed protein product [Cylindrotheca closterium]|uniref:F-box domain-containing protein n=1 Tax=Cylindrotheca closterium TaxID=2856 RepID=A0AAD2CS95_9STRA|nr:unnamed protein product [Cylindrotheca closterium]